MKNLNFSLPHTGWRIVVAVLLFTPPLNAATSKTWVGGTGTQSDTSANWSPSGAPTGVPSGTLTPSYDFTFNSASNLTVTLETGSAGTGYATQSLLFGTGAAAFTINANGGLNSEDRFALLNGATITQSSAANQTINATVLLNEVSEFVTVTGSGAGTLTLNSVRFSANATVATAPILYLGRNTTLGDITHAANRPGTLRVGDGATVTFSTSGTAAELRLILGQNASGTSSSAIVDATLVGGFTAAGTVVADTTTFQGNHQMTFSGDFVVSGVVDKTFTFTNSSALGVTWSGTHIAFGATTGNTSRVITLNVAAGSRATLSGAISGSTSTGTTGLTKSGSGTLTLAGSNNYNGTTTITSGTLVINGNQPTATGAVIVQNGGTLSGSGTLGGVVIVQSGGTLNPGNSPGNQNVAGLVFPDGGNYNWQILNATDSAGSGYDTYTVAPAGSLDLSALTGAVKFNLNLWSLSATGPDVNGNALNFDASSNHSWTLIATSNLISNFDPADFQINLGSINGTGGFTNALNGGAFSLALTDGGTDLSLQFAATAIPEPSSALLLSGGLAMWLLCRTRLRR